MREELPNDWKLKRLGSICNLQNGFAFRSKDYVSNSNTLIFRMSQIRPGGSLDLNHNSKFLPDDFVSKYRSYLLNDGDVVIAMTDMATETKILGLPTYFKTDGRSFLLNQRVGKLFDFNKSEVEVRFLRYMLSAPQIIQYYKSFGKGALQINLGKEDILNAEIPIPPIKNQLAIVSKIEELFSEIENGIKSLFTAKEQLKKYRQSVLKWAFEGKLTNGLNGEKSLNYDLFDLPDEHDLSIAAEPEAEYKVEKNHNNQKNQKNHSSDKGELPEGWKMKKLVEIGTWKGGGTPSKANKDFWEKGNILWVSPKDMKSKTIHDTIDKITIDAIANSSAKLIDKGSILFVVRSGILRRTLPVAITTCDVTVNQDLQAFTPRDVLPDYVYWYVQSKNQDIRRDCSKDGTTVESIESSLLKNYLIPVCSSHEQNLIVQAIESRLSVADKIEESITQSLQQAEALKQSILKKAFEGKLIQK